MIKGNELTTLVMKLAHGVRNESSPPENKDIWRDFQCSAFNTLASVIICTQSQIKFYEAFFFKDLHHLLELIIDIHV